MQELGFQACCLRCDAPDEAGVARCSTCIQHHRNVRETIASAPPDDPLYQLAKEIMAMAAEPHRYDHDEVHGQSLIEQQRLAGQLVGTPIKRTEHDVAMVFQAQREVEKSNALRDIGNQNPWKDQLPPEEVLEYMANTLEVEEMDHGSRTIPSRPIAAVDRSDRLGEDRKMVDKIEAEKASSEAPESLKEVIETEAIAQRELARKEWENAQSGVSELLDDDLDL